MNKIIKMSVTIYGKKQVYFTTPKLSEVIYKPYIQSCAFLL